ncbi:hypothetical protein DH2020_015643 [Rehmannia glutinosa]|uniref:DUF4283 domain-containing protein n=1 Tax=Rehmannia glutinosa TaxID=99300 RepID=A0ABR0WTT3_REHGL
MVKHPQSSLANEKGGTKNIFFNSPIPDSSESKTRTIEGGDSETLGDSDSSSFAHSQDDLLSVSCTGDINLPEEDAILHDPRGICTGLKPDPKGAYGNTSPNGNGNVAYTGPSFKYPNPSIPSKFKRKSFADLLTVQQSDELKIKPMECDSTDSDFIEFNDDELCDIPNEWGYCLLGCFAGKCPGMGGPFHCLGRPLLLKIFDFEKPPQGVNCAPVPIWVKFPFLPGKYWNPAAFSRLCSKIGKPICSDRPTFEKTRPAFARLLVDVNPTVLPPKSVLLKQKDGSFIEQSVVIDFFPAFCKKCKNFGHFVDDCGVKKPAENLKTHNGKKNKDNGKKIIQTAVFDPDCGSDDLRLKTGDSTTPKTLPSVPSKEDGKVHKSASTQTVFAETGSMLPILETHDTTTISVGGTVIVPPTLVTNDFTVTAPTDTAAAAISDPLEAQKADKLVKLPPGPLPSHKAEKLAELNSGPSSSADCPGQTSHDDDLEFSPALSKSAKKKLKKRTKKTRQHLVLLIPI